MQKQLTSAGIDYAPFFTERTCESIQFEVRRFCNGHTEFRYEEPYIQQKVYLAIQRAVGAGRYHPEFICRDGSLTSPHTFAKGIMRMRMAHMHCDLLEERRPTQSAAIELASPAVGTADSDVDTVDSDRAGFASNGGTSDADMPVRAFCPNSADGVGSMEAATGGRVSGMGADTGSVNLNGEYNNIIAGQKPALWEPPLAAALAVWEPTLAADSAMEADTVSDPSPSPFEALDAQEQQEKIDTAVASMAPDVRAAWNGLAYDGISWSELGRREGISDNGARKRYKPKFLDAFADTVGSDTAIA